jgi:hypothetical protein
MSSPSLLLEPDLAFLAQRLRDGTWSLHFNGYDVLGDLHSWNDVERFIRQMQICD